MTWWGTASLLVTKGYFLVKRGNSPQNRSQRGRNRSCRSLQRGCRNSIDQGRVRGPTIVRTSTKLETVLTTSCPTIVSRVCNSGSSLNDSPKLFLPVTTLLGSKDSCNLAAHSKVFALIYSSKRCVTNDCKSFAWIAASWGSSSCASGSGADAPCWSPFGTVGIVKLDFRPGNDGLLFPEIVCTNDNTASVAEFEGRNVERIAMRELERNLDGYFVLMRGCRIERRLIRVQNRSIDVGSIPSVFSPSSESSSSNCNASVTFSTTSRGFPSRAMVVRHVPESDRGRRRWIKSQPMFCVNSTFWRISFRVGRISGDRCDSRIVR